MLSLLDIITLIRAAAVEARARGDLSCAAGIEWALAQLETYLNQLGG